VQSAHQTLSINDEKHSRQSRRVSIGGRLRLTDCGGSNGLGFPGQVPFPIASLDGQAVGYQAIHRKPQGIHDLNDI
jgi:hypothetical protein